MCTPAEHTHNLPEEEAEEAAICDEDLSPLNCDSRS
jgi:hypothetical protein